MWKKKKSFVRLTKRLSDDETGVIRDFIITTKYVTRVERVAN